MSEDFGQTKVEFLSNSSKAIAPNPNAGMELSAEFLFVAVFGKSYDHRASRFLDLAYFKAQCRKMFKRFARDITRLQATEGFKDLTLADLNYLERHTLPKRFEEQHRPIVLASLKIVADFLGYRGRGFRKLDEPYFIGSLWSERGSVSGEEYYRYKYSLEIGKRLQIVQQLSDEGLKSEEIALILNLSAYQVAQYKKQLEIEKRAK